MTESELMKLISLQMTQAQELLKIKDLNTLDNFINRATLFQILKSIRKNSITLEKIEYPRWGEDYE